MWALLKKEADVDGRRRAVAEHNAGNLFVKRGLAMAACRFVMSVDAKPAIVSIHHDGSVHVTSAGHEMGQVRAEDCSPPPPRFFSLFFFLLHSPMPPLPLPLSLPPPFPSPPPPHFLSSLCPSPNNNNNDNDNDNNRESTPRCCRPPTWRSLRPSPSARRRCR